MNQPKFKVGDVLYFPGRKDKEGKKIVVDSIRISKAGVQYCDGGIEYVHESHLELYQEPQKKKLYAYRRCGKFGEIIFLIGELERGVDEVNLLSRAPDYDIEYPEVE